MTVICKNETVAADSPIGKYLKDSGSWDVPNYISRGDITAYDFDKNDFISDDIWRNLDLSAIIPANAILVRLRVYVKSNATSKTLYFRKDGNSNVYNVDGARTQAANIAVDNCNVIVEVVNQIIEYCSTSGATWANQDVVVLGWWI